MHVIILCDFAVPTGGSQKVAIQSARALADAGLTVTFVHAISGRDALLDHPAIECIDLGFQDVWDRPIAQAAVSGIWNRVVRRVLPEILARRSKAPAILHLHQWTRAFSPSVFAAALASGIPLVVTAHDYFLRCPNGVYYRFDREQPCALEPLSARCLAAFCDPKSPMHKLIRVGRSIATAAAISGKQFDLIHVSDRGRTILAPLLPSTVRHHRIDNPIDLRRDSAATIGVSARFAFIGRLTKEKGAVAAAEAARMAETAITFIGDGPAEAEVRSVNPSAELLGWRSGADVAGLLAGQIKAVVAPSLWYETGPLTVAEAAAAGVGAIASNRCGAAEGVKHGKTGLIVEPHPNDLANAMRLMDDRRTAQTFGQAAYDEYWARPPNTEAHAKSLIALYELILSCPIDKQIRHA